MMTVTRDDQHDPGIEAEQRVLPDVGEEEHQQDGETSEQQQRRQEVLSLEARRSELEIKLIAARSAVSSAVERKEFMEEEVEQARDYDKKLAQEMTRLARIAQNLPPEQSALLEKLRRLVVTLTEVERQEIALHEDARAREEALRSEIEDFIGVPVTAVDAPVEGFTAEETGASTALLRPTSGGIGASAGGRVFEDPPVDDPLAVIPTSGEAGGGPADAEEPGSGGGLRNAGGSSLQRMLVTSAPATIKRLKKQPKKEGRALLAQGLDRIEAAHKSAAAEREAAASSLSLLRLAVAKRQRLEDAAPGHAELLQYLLRFEELGHHAAERQNQLRKCRAERSTLALTREFLANQARLMESIASGVGDASKGGKAAREAYLRQLEGIAQGVEDHLANQTRLLNSATIRRKAAEEAKETLKDDRTRFLAYTRELAEECYRYDALSAHLALMRR